MLGKLQWQRADHVLIGVVCELLGLGLGSQRSAEVGVLID